ncbi:hypothetical protein B0H66DRAFT_176399 [Apodospora peruviana]|uniref:Secreted protein n=1 Tax=Apodospora peruviana TaxID=516989 RepID=A0AAE0M6Y9_9PEZI|nr:hypothetical protein B0H66DRAFT_176399 [Apodospora peruviana]
MYALCSVFSLLIRFGMLRTVSDSGKESCCFFCHAQSHYLPLPATEFTMSMCSDTTHKRKQPETSLSKHES